MSLQTWKDEFYPVDAEKAVEGLSGIDLEREATKHSLRKWEGLTSENLRKHQVIAVNAEIGDQEEIFSLHTDTCALCVAFMHDHGDECSSCLTCPLYKTLGDRECDDPWAPYLEFVDNQNPMPMIQALKETLVRIEKCALTV